VANFKDLHLGHAHQSENLVIGYDKDDLGHAHQSEHSPSLDE